MPIPHRPSRTPDRSSHLRLVCDNTPPLAPAGAAPTTARQRIEIVPLPEPAIDRTTAEAPSAPLDPPALFAPLPVTRDRRLPRPDAHVDPLARLTCSMCGHRARVDIIDLRTRRVHLSCDGCYRMWQEQIRRDDPASITRRT